MICSQSDRVKGCHRERVRSPEIAGYLVLVVTAGLVLGPRVGAAVAAAGTLSALAIAVARWRGRSLKGPLREVSLEDFPDVWDHIPFT